MPDTVRMSCVLRGMDREAQGVLVTWKDVSESGRVYMRAKITEEPANLPDGVYTISFGGHEISTRKWSGQWRLIYLPPGIDIDQVA